MNWSRRNAIKAAIGASIGSMPALAAKAREVPMKFFDPTAETFSDVKGWLEKHDHPRVKRIYDWPEGTVHKEFFVSVWARPNDEAFIEKHAAIGLQRDLFWFLEYRLNGGSVYWSIPLEWASYPNIEHGWLAIKAYCRCHVIPKELTG